MIYYFLVLYLVAVDYIPASLFEESLFDEDPSCLHLNFVLIFQLHNGGDLLAFEAFKSLNGKLCKEPAFIGL